VYILTAVARVHQLYKPIEALKPLLIFAGLGLLLYMVDKQRVRRMAQLKDRTSKAIAFILVWAVLGVPFGIYRTNSIFYLREEIFPVAALFLLVAGSIRDLTDVRRLMYVYGGGIVYLALIALARRHGGMRMGSVTYDPNDLGMVLVAALPVGIYALTRAQGVKAKLFAVVALIVLATALVETDSRGAFLALVAVIIYTLFFLRGVSKSWRLGAGAAIIGLLALTATGSYWERMRTIFAPGDDYNETSLTGRKKIWKRGMGYMMDHPIFGVGVDNFASAEGRSDVVLERQSRGQGTKWSAPHSSWVQAGAEMGIPGFIAIIVFYLGALIQLRRLSNLALRKGVPKEVREGADMAAALFGVLFGVMVAASFITQQFGYAVWAGAGLAAGLIKVMRFYGLDGSVNGRAGAKAGRRGSAPRPVAAAALPGSAH
jgi:O-antigen ligase